MSVLYNGFARVYDKLQNVDYEKIIEYIGRITEKYGVTPCLALDLACGTGNITIPLARRGYDMIGIDLSVDMLMEAKRKAEAEGLNILFLNQDMTEFELYGTVDIIFCMLDSLNYISDEGGLKKVFSLAHNYLNPNGIMIFDINTEYKLSEVLDGNVFAYEEEGVFMVWRNSYDRDERVCEFNLSFFETEDGENYSRFDEFHYETAYSVEKISEIVRASGFEVLEINDGFSFEKPTDKSEKVSFVIRKA